MGDTTYEADNLVINCRSCHLATFKAGPFCQFGWEAKYEPASHRIAEKGTH
ncbi:uncharacterized protein BKA55DRAFT_578520, partial [Fusarium redolens]